MALFKIEKGLAADLLKNRPNTTEGWCYFTVDDGKFYIDIETGENTGSNLSYRVPLNADKASRLEFFDTGSELKYKYSIGENGQCCVVKETESLWVYADGWKDTLVKFYTKDDIDFKLSNKLGATDPAYKVGHDLTIIGETRMVFNGSRAVEIELPYASRTTPAMASGEGDPGHELAYARGDHVHPPQTSVTGNAGSATRLEKPVKINGVLFDGTQDINIASSGSGEDLVELTTEEIDQLWSEGE